MISRGMRIQWTDSIEYIAIDLDKLHLLPQITSTMERWPGADEEWVEFFTTSELIKKPRGMFELHIKYEATANQHLSIEDVCFGTSIIELSSKANFGKAYWKDDSGPLASGLSTWKRINLPLKVEGPRKHENISRIQRKQQQFKTALLARDKKCVLSSETNPAALEAAHVIRASNGGRELIENGLILRADIHRLYDAGLFTIDTKGRVHVKETLNGNYRQLLKGARLPDATLKRVKEALSLC